MNAFDVIPWREVGERGDLDPWCREQLAWPGNNMLAHWYLKASYAYHVLHQPIITDDLYDEICRTLLTYTHLSLTEENRRLIDRNGLLAGTGYYLGARVGWRVRKDAMICVRQVTGAYDEQGNMPC